MPTPPQPTPPQPTPPHLYALRAKDAPLAAVFIRRGKWFQLARWDLRSGDVERGAWFSGKIYQRRCDVSPDGRWLYYFAMKGGTPFHAISRVPWLTALAFWKDNTTYSDGAHFMPSPRATGSRMSKDTDHGDISPLTKRFALIHNDGQPYAAERTRGWSSHPDAQPHIAGDHFHERRHQWLICRQPTGKSILALRDNGHTRGHLEGRAPCYSLDDAPLPDVTWADWDPTGRLLVATRDARLEIRTADGDVIKSTSLADFAPDPQPPPPRASRW